jgi:branched-chain amino acid transport system permease protein
MSLVMLTGWSGQISLGQFAIVTIGAFVAGNLALNAGFPFLATLPVAGIAGTVFALLVGIPALRIRGLFLAVTTFAIAIVLPLFIFDNNFLGDFVPRQDITRPRLFFLDFNDQRSWYYLGLVFFLLFALSMRALRKSRAGRVLIAMRDNEDGVQAFGVDIVRTRLIAFGLSGFIAGVGGALVLYGSRGMGDVGLFSFGTSLNLFVLVVIGGVSSVFGAFLGALYFVAAGILFPSFAQLTQGILGLMFLMFIPGGLTQVVFGFRDAILRVVAMRQHIIVPSLFADYSPEAWEKRLAPLAQPVQSQGLAALRHDQRYALPSYLYGKAQA